MRVRSFDVFGFTRPDPATIVLASARKRLGDGTNESESGTNEQQSSLLVLRRFVCVFASAC